MLSALKNYAITFLIAAIIFALIAFFVVQIIVGSLGDSFVVDANPTVTSTPDPAQTTAAPVTEPPDQLDGSSFNVLLIGVDYAPDLFNNYAPTLVEALTPETTAAEPAATTAPPETVAPPAAITVVEETTVADTGILMPDGSLYFEGGFFSNNYRPVQTDTLVLLRFDKERTQVTFTAFPGDMLLTIEGRDLLLRDVFNTYGLDFLLRKLHAITGLPIDRYVMVNIEQFPAIVDALDGIVYTVPCDMKYDDFKGNLHINLKAGSQKLTGDTALQMLRFNGYTDGKNSRLKTAISFTRAMMQKMTNLIYLPKAGELYDSVKQLLVTNFTAADLAANLDLIFKYGEYQLLELPFPGTTASDGNGGTIFRPDLDRSLSFFGDYRRIYS